MKWLSKWFNKKATTQNETLPTRTSIRLPKQWTMPIAGNVIPLTDLPDPAFAEGMMGAGFAIRATSSHIVSPVSGEISAIFPGGHAIGITDDEGCELLIHVGIDSVNLHGNGFHPLVEQGCHVAAGTPILDVDFAFLAQHISETAVIIVFPDINEGNISINDGQLSWQEQP